MNRTVTLAIVVALIVGSIVYIESKKSHPSASDTPVEYVTAASTTPAEKTSKFELAREITTPDGFVNTGGKPIAISDYVGNKVVLIDFWTYSCINCQRTLPYLEGWYQKYKDYGLEVVGIHTPEFEFEKNYQNVSNAVARLGVTFPVVLDNDFSTWNAYQNNYWPHKYLIDIDGYVVFDHIGEGNYATTEDAIRKALEERATLLHTGQTIPSGYVNPNAPAIQAGSPETYFGSERNEYLGNGSAGQSGVKDFTLPASPSANTLYLGGTWNMMPEYAVAQDGDTILYKYTARSIYFVASSNATSTLTLIQDGKPAGTVDVGPATLYPLVQNPAAGTHTLEIHIKGSGLEAFTFTFG